MKGKCYMVIHEEKVSKQLHHKVFSTKELADNYAEELTIVTNEAKWIEIRMFDVHNEDSFILTPVQEDMYWDSVDNLQKEQHYGDQY